MLSCNGWSDIICVDFSPSFFKMPGESSALGEKKSNNHDFLSRNHDIEKLFYFFFQKSYQKFYIDGTQVHGNQCIPGFIGKNSKISNFFVNQMFEWVSFDHSHRTEVVHHFRNEREREKKNIQIISHIQRHKYQLKMRTMILHSKTRTGNTSESTSLKKKKKCLI